MSEQLKNKNMEDHDLLIRLDTQMKILMGSIKDLNDNTIVRINELYKIKMSKDDFHSFEKAIENLHSDMEKRIRSVERFTWIAIGVITIVQMIGIPLILKFIL